MSDDIILKTPDDFANYKQALDAEHQYTFYHHGAPTHYPCKVFSMPLPMFGTNPIVTAYSHTFVYLVEGACHACGGPIYHWPAFSPIPDEEVKTVTDRLRVEKSELWKKLAKDDQARPFVLTDEQKAAILQPTVEKRTLWQRVVDGEIDSPHPLQDFGFSQYRGILDLERAFSLCQAQGVSFVYNGGRLYPYLHQNRPTNQLLGVMVEDADASNSFIHDAPIIDLE